MNYQLPLTDPEVCLVRFALEIALAQCPPDREDDWNTLYRLIAELKAAEKGLAIKVPETL